MASTFYVDGQQPAVNAAWLNDVNNAVYLNQNPSANPTAPFAFSTSAAYVSGTFGAAVLDGLVNVMWFLTEAERTQVKANTTTLDLTTKINAAKVFGGNRPLYFPRGTYSFTGFDGKGNYGGIVGDGMYNTILKVRSAVTNALDYAETADVIISPLILKGFTLDGNNLAVNGINIRYRHHSNMEQVYVINCTSWSVVEKDSFLGRRYDCRSTGSTNGWWLVGSNHASVFTGCVFTGSSGIHLLIQSLGTALDGNYSLSFNGCTVTDGTGTGVDFLGSSAVFNGCYLGENITGPTVINRGGVVDFVSGTMFFGATATSFLIAPAGGKTTFEKCKLAGQTFSSVTMLSSTATGGKWSLRDCDSSLVIGGDPVLSGDSLDYGPPAQVFSKRLGRVLTSNAVNATRTELISGNAITTTCTAAPGPTPTMTITALLTQVHPDWRDGENLYLVVVYNSNADFSIRWAGSAGGGAPSAAVGVLPSTSSAIKTYVKMDALLAAANYDRLEFYRANCAVNDFLKIEEVFIADSRMLNKGTGVLGNLYKC